jgi:hypothetical protein
VTLPDRMGMTQREARNARGADHDEGHAAFRSREGQTGAWHDRTAIAARQPQAVQCVTSRTGASMYEGSEAAWKPKRCAPIAIIAVAAPARRDGSMLGRVSSIYAACFCSDGLRATGRPFDAAAAASSSSVASFASAMSDQCSDGMLSRCAQERAVCRETRRSPARRSAPAALTISVCVLIHQ